VNRRGSAVASGSCVSPIKTYKTIKTTTTTLKPKQNKGNRQPIHGGICCCFFKTKKARVRIAHLFQWPCIRLGAPHPVWLSYIAALLSGPVIL
jgi:hypothetical protein